MSMVFPDEQRDTIFLRCMVAGAVAGSTVDVLLFPLDSIKTRLQAKDTLLKRGNLRKIYSGLPVVLLGNSLGSAVFFATYEQSKVLLGNSLGSAVFFATYEQSKACLRSGAPAPGSGLWEAALVDGTSAVLGELVACTLRTPTEILKQRMQALQIAGMTQGLREISFRTFSFGFRATALRDLVFSAIQYPSYESLRALVATEGQALSAWESALCGCVTGFFTAILTNPLDVVKTRIMLNEEAYVRRPRSIFNEIAEIYQLEGPVGFFRGSLCRGLWMALGGLVFLGSYEKVKEMLKHESAPLLPLRDLARRSRLRPSPYDCTRCEDREVEGGFITYRRCWFAGVGLDQPGYGCGILQTLYQATVSARQRRTECCSSIATQERVGGSAAQEEDHKDAAQPQLLVARELVAGGFAGCTVDVVLHPIDTLKTRLQAANGFWIAGGFRGLWRGVSAPALAGVPSSAVFWAVYAPTKLRLATLTGSNTQAEIIAGPASEVAALIVRVPSEMLKQRMQAGIHRGRLLEQVREIYKSQGARGFYGGFAATCYRSVPFALIQFPVYEELKRQLEQRSSRSKAWTGAVSGALAGGVAGVVTTPLDVIKTRIMLSQLEARLNFMQMAGHIARKEGWRGLFAGVVPRGLYLAMGGMVYLGVYNGASDYMCRGVV